ncbi:integral membrane sensor signal transduction histidine kinase [Pandoraea communis]|uniref:Integral membrane sensor signal transduction histidine kinase n=1 Tax=Pandoraea communis TaxID=2508297 RepID=A0A5E4X6D2_9BURK|nr:histidine kinase [Pandoraea communis]VVE31853.1 integral membrane sensor signal transduction histidine kinase [Pandoraea communis]
MPRLFSSWLRRRSWIIAMIAAIVITVGSLIGLESAHRRLASTYETALQAMTAANELNEIMAHTSTVVSSQRGYLLTNNASYLDPYLSAVRRIRALAMLIIQHYENVGDAQATREFSDVMTLFSQRIAAMEAARAALRQGEMSLEEALSPANVGMGTLEPVQNGITDLYNRELARARAAQNNGRFDQAISAVSAGALSVLTILLFILLFRTLGRQMRQEELARDQLREQQAHLDRLVRERTEQLDELATHLQNVSEDEKTRLSRELHDELGSILTACKMDVTWAHHKLRSTDPVIAEKLARAQRNLDSGIQTKRRIIENLRPTVLINFGLVTALRSLAEEAADQQHWQLDLDLPEEDFALPESTAIALFRVAQESLTNAGKYARATAVRVALACDDQRVRLEVIDNGIGLTPDQFNKPKTHGLFGMRQRVSAKGGRIDIHSLPQRLGTEIQVVLPLCSPADALDIATEVTESTAPQVPARANRDNDTGNSSETSETPQPPSPPVGMH